ncbi:21022_t:CDS:2 [Gigaspora rosea]|nr:21022_t:CDS:2 [Gigaspora rosea]
MFSILCADQCSRFLRTAPDSIAATITLLASPPSDSSGPPPDGVASAQPPEIRLKQTM